jgi:hypothetical protein
MDRVMDKHFEAGLINLKNAAENKILRLGG